MTGWDILNNVINGFPPVATALLLAAAVVATVVFIVGFSRHGVDFVKHGFKQNFFNELTANLATKEDIAGLRSEFKGLQTELETIKVNHFGHLKDFLAELTGILVDRNVINHQDKARLDSKLRGM